MKRGFLTFCEGVEFSDETQMYVALKNRAEELLPKFKHFLSVAANGQKYITNIKTLDSFKRKLARKDNDIRNVHDVLRGAILTDKWSQACSIAFYLKWVPNLVEWDFKDSDEGYTGAWHFKVNIEGMICEIQLMMKETWAYKEAAHPLYKRQQAEGKDKSVTRFMNFIYKQGTLDIPKNV